MKLQSVKLAIVAVIGLAASPAYAGGLLGGSLGGSLGGGLNAGAGGVGALGSLDATGATSFGGELRHARDADRQEQPRAPKSSATPAKSAQPAPAREPEQPRARTTSANGSVTQGADATVRPHRVGADAQGSGMIGVEHSGGKSESQGSSQPATTPKSTANAGASGSGEAKARN